MTSERINQVTTDYPEPMSDKEEIWKQIPEYKAQASSLGRIKSFYMSPGGRIRKFYLAKNGYLRIQFQKKKGHKTVHRLIAEAFIPNPNNLPWINHINGIKTDNRPVNLEWCTASYNQRHSIKMGLKKIQYGIHTSGAKFDEIQIKTIKTCIRDGMRNCDLARYFKVKNEQISNIRHGKIWRTVTI